MLQRFDHAVIAVRDLDSAIAHCREVLGLDARPGGRHTGRGTHNGLIRFGVDYLELLAVYDPAEARASGPNGSALVDYLAQHEGGPVGYCLAADALDALAGRVRAAGLEVEGPLAMERERPDGPVLRWRLLVPGGVAWRRPWPFVIQWALPDAERLKWEQPGAHELGAMGVAGVTVLIRDLDGGRHLYERQLGLALECQDTVPELGATRARYRLGDFAIALVAPSGNGPLRAELDRAGEGPYQVTLRVASLVRAASVLQRAGVALRDAPGTPGGRLIPPEQALGTRFALVETPE